MSLYFSATDTIPSTSKLPNSQLIHEKWWGGGTTYYHDANTNGTTQMHRKLPTMRDKWSGRFYDLTTRLSDGKNLSSSPSPSPKYIQACVRSLVFEAKLICKSMMWHFLQMLDLRLPTATVIIRIYIFKNKVLKFFVLGFPSSWTSAAPDFTQH